MTAIKTAIYELLAEEHPATDRQVFYRIETTGLIAKTEAEYKGTIIRLLSQMRLLNLSTRPTKTKGTHAKNFVGDSTEVDAIPPKVLRQIVSDCITRHVDQRAYDSLRQAEAGEREALMAVARQYEGFSEGLVF